MSFWIVRHNRSISPTVIYFSGRPLRVEKKQSCVCVPRIREFSRDSRYLAANIGALEFKISHPINDEKTVENQKKS